MSYNEQYSALFGNGPLEQLELRANKPVPKPVRDAQREEEGATKVVASDVYAKQRRPLWGGRKWSITDLSYCAFIFGMHLVACLAPMTYSPSMVGLFFALYFVSGCLGITLSYHRQLSHRAFQTPKWLEYTLAYCGVLAAQGDPLEWVSGHRYHHLHTDTPLDPHSPFEGLWWSHAGWLLDNDVSAPARPPVVPPVRAACRALPHAPPPSATAAAPCRVPTRARASATKAPAPTSPPPTHRCLLLA
jgi:stearoyl-CoA desaturase (delta-9 desaturase)